MQEDKIVNYIEKNKQEYIRFLQTLVKTDSYNPPGNEKNLAKIIGEYLEEDQIDYETFPFGENRANLIAYLNSNKEGQNLLYNGHMDIVPAGDTEEWKYPPLSGKIEDGVLYGRGAVDMKSGLAAMIVALKILKQLDIPVSGNLILNAVSDEETGGFKGTNWMIENVLDEIKIDFTVIGEPTRMKPLPIGILMGEKGHFIVKIITKGKSCHSSMPTLGRNAITMMNKFLYNIDKLDDFLSDISPPMSLQKLKNLIQDVLPQGLSLEVISKKYTLLKDLLNSLVSYSKNVTVIKGGIKENVIPDQCEALIDFRLLPGQSPDEILKALQQLANELGFTTYENKEDLRTGGIIFEVELKTGASYWSEWENDDTLTMLHDTVKETFEEKPLYFLFPASSDARLLRNSKKCEQTILFGPGNATTAHSTDENIELDEFINIIKTYTLFAYRFLK